MGKKIIMKRGDMGSGKSHIFNQYERKMEKFYQTNKKACEIFNLLGLRYDNINIRVADNLYLNGHIQFTDGVVDVKETVKQLFSLAYEEGKQDERRIRQMKQGCCPMMCR